MGHLFVSYSRHDIKTADYLVDKLEGSGYRVWIDRDKIQAGDQWRYRIVKAIRECQAFIILLSKNSVKSRDVRKELDIADSKRKVMIPITISVLDIPDEMEYQLAGCHRFDLTINLDAGIRRLIDDLVGMRERAQIAAVRIDPSYNEDDEKLITFLLEGSELRKRADKILDELIDLDKQFGQGSSGNEIGRRKQRYPHERTDSLLRKLQEIKEKRERNRQEFMSRLSHVTGPIKAWPFDSS